MLPGCQSAFKHRVLAGTASGHRYSLSFRSIKTPSYSSSPTDPIMCTQSLSPNTGIEVKPQASLILGTSITKNLIPEKLIKRGSPSVCFNRSTGGARIRDAIDNLKDFHSSHGEKYNVTKVFLSIGTNDIRYCEHGVGHLKFFLNKLVCDTKYLFPNAKIYMQSLIPIKRRNMFTAKNVLDFNRLIYEMCVLHKCYYMDIFKPFLNYYGSDINSLLYTDEVHLNQYGTVMLARAYKAIINNFRFNPCAF